MNKYKHYLILFLVILSLTGYFMVHCISNRKIIDKTNETRSELFYKCQTDEEFREKVDYYCYKLGEKPEKK